MTRKSTVLLVRGDDAQEAFEASIERLGGALYQSSMGLLAIFSTPLEAARCALDLQQKSRDIAQVLNHGSLSIARVHGTLLAPSAERSQGWYRQTVRGPALELGERILEQTRSGQTLISESFDEVMGSEGWAKIGTRPLRTRLWSLGPTGTDVALLLAPGDLRRAETEPLRARTNIDVDEGFFVGRDRDLEVTERLLEESRVVSLCGPRGSGKSKLARVIGARRLERRAHEGVWYIDLKSTKTLPEVHDAIARAFAIEYGSRDQTETLTHVARMLRHLAPCTMILDHLDRVDGRVQRALGQFIDETEHVRWLLVARRAMPLGSPWPLGPLSVMEATALFHEHALKQRPDLELDEDCFSTIVDIVDHLGRLPLAIELTAPLLRLMPLERLQATMRPELVDASTKSLTDLTTHAWRILDETSAQVLARCSVFEGGFDLRAACVVCDLDEVALKATFEALIERAMLCALPSPRSTQRFKLCEVFQQLASSERPADVEQARPRHTRYFIGQAEHHAAAIHTSDEVDARQALAENRENFIAACQRAIELGQLEAAPGIIGLQPYLISTGQVFTLLSLAEQALEQIEGLSVEARVGLLLAIASAQRQHGNVRLAHGRCVEARAVLDEEGDCSPGIELTFARVYSGVLAEMEEFDESERLRREGLRLAERVGDCSAQVSLLHQSIFSAYRRGDLDLALKQLDRARAIADRCAHPSSQATASKGLGLIELARGDLAAAHRHTLEAFETWQRLDHRREMLICMVNLSSITSRSGDREAASRWLRDGARLARRLPLRPLETLILVNQGIHQLNSLEFVSAHLTLTEAMHLTVPGETRSSTQWMVLVYLSVAEQIVGLGVAQEYLDRAREMANTQATNDPELERWRRVFDTAQRVIDAIDAQRRGDAEAFSHLKAQIEETEQGPTEDHIGALLKVFEAYLSSLDVAASSPAPPSEDVFAFDEELRWFSPPNRARVDIRRRGALRRILKALVTARLDAPGVPLGIAEIIARGWPEQTIIPSAGQARAYVAISTLRKLGLRDLLLRESEGYLLDPNIDIAEAHEH